MITSSYAGHDLQEGTCDGSMLSKSSFKLLKPVKSSLFLKEKKNESRLSWRKWKVEEDGD